MTWHEHRSHAGGGGAAVQRDKGADQADRGEGVAEAQASEQIEEDAEFSGSVKRLGAHSFEFVDQRVGAPVKAFDHRHQEFVRLDRFGAEGVAGAQTELAHEDELGPPVALAEGMDRVEIGQKVRRMNGKANQLPPLPVRTVRYSPAHW